MHTGALQLPEFQRGWVGDDNHPFQGRKRDTDGWDRWLTDMLSTHLGRAAATDVTLGFADLDGWTVARVVVGPAARPVFVAPSEGDQTVR